MAHAIQRTTVYPGDEVQNALTGEHFTYKGTERVLGETRILLERDGQVSRVDLATFKEFFAG